MTPVFMCSRVPLRDKGFHCHPNTSGKPTNLPQIEFTFAAQDFRNGGLRANTGRSLWIKQCSKEGLKYPLIFDAFAA